MGACGWPGEDVWVERAVPFAGWFRIVTRRGLVSKDLLSQISKQKRREFLRVVPEFVVEVTSPSDRLAAAQKKMRLWAANGVELGWLIDGDARRVYVNRGNSEPRIVADAESIAGEGPVEGLVLQLGEIWEGL
jgi:Uma2 family endonuclease